MKTAVIGGLAVVVAVLGWVFLGPGGDEAAIRARLDRLSDAVKVGDAENPIVRHARVSGEFKQIFAKDVTIEIPELTAVTSGRQELAALATHATAQWKALAVAWSNVQVQLDPPKKTARVGVTATLLGTRNSGERERDVREVTMRFDKVDGEWRGVGVVVSPRVEAR